MGLLAKIAKKSIKKINQEFTKKYKNKIYKEESQDYNKSDGEHLYENIPVASDVKTEEKRSPSSPSEPLITQPDLLCDSSVDSGISESEPSSTQKKTKKIQFTTALVHEFNRETFETSSYPSKIKNEAPQLCTVKYFEVPSPQTIQIIERRVAQNRDEDNPSETTLHYLDPCDIISIPKIYAVPIGSESPLKPPRRAQHLVKINYSGLPYKDTTSQNSTSMDGFGHSTPKKEIMAKTGVVQCIKGKTINAGVYSSSSLDVEDVEKMLSPLPRKRDSTILATTPPEPVYAQITPKKRSIFDEISTPWQFSTPMSSNSSTPQPATSSDETNLSAATNSHDFLPGATSSCNELLTKTTKDSLNLIHKTNWTLNKEEILKDHDCRLEKRRPQELSLDKKFVPNLFESRSSGRWDKTLRNAHEKKPSEFAQKTCKNLENNLTRVGQNYDGIEDDIEMLEKEFKKLESETNQIKRELQKMLRQNKAKCGHKTLLTPTSFLNKANEEDSPLQTPRSNECLSEQDKRYRMLRKARDIECFRMAQASKALKEIRSKRSNRDWLEVLVAERILLETSERVNLLTEEITENSYTKIPEPPLHKGTLHLSDIKFPFAKHFQDNHRRDRQFTEFFLMTVSHGTKVFMSEFITGEMDPLCFKNRYSFKDVAPDFEIKVKLFCLRLRTSDVFFWERFTCSACCPTSRIIYEDLLTHQYQERTVFKTSFKLCGEATLTNSQINEPSTTLVLDPQVFNKLEGTIEHHFKCEAVDMAVSLSGFLDVGTLLGETYFWERKWCTLKGPNLFIYNYPQDEYFGGPVEQINLEYCFGPIINKVENCSKKRCFQLRTGRPNDAPPQNPEKPLATLRSKPNFALRKFYFAARDAEDYAKWTVVVEKLLDSLRYFKKLAFEEEYNECVW